LKPLLIIIGSIFYSFVNAQTQPNDSNFIKTNFTKTEVMIPMRDGAKLYTAIYTPTDAGTEKQYPFLIERTPYSCDPYGSTAYPYSLGPNAELQNEKYIFVYQDVRGRYKSQGQFEEMTPHIANKKNKQDVDESSDTYDTVEWLINNVKGNNGKAGLYGISYPGFYATASLPNAHPAIKAVSPQAPVTDEFLGDDANHNGAFFLMDNFSFINFFDGKRNTDSTEYQRMFATKITDAYDYYLKLGAVANTNGSAYYNQKSPIWNQYLAHDTYDDFWKARNIRTHLKNIQPAVLVVGGLYDAEDLFGALKTYESIEKQSTNSNNYLVMGPWTHGAWARPIWTKYGTVDFGKNVNEYYKKIETNFFNYFLKGIGTHTLKKATIFNTATYQWNEYATWPPATTKATNYYLSANGMLSTTKPTQALKDGYVSNPNKPVPYVNEIGSRRQNEYMINDQRFAAKRPDVLVYETEILEKDITIAGGIIANMGVSLQTLDNNKTKKLDADFVVKIIDILPQDAPPVQAVVMANMQRLVRAEVIRGKFRNSFEKPEAFVPGKIANVPLTLPDVLHTFKKGHRIMVQIQSSWFPLVDRNPQQFLKIPNAKPQDFIPLLINLHHQNTSIILPILE
jgi:uncharacterized protein